MEPCKTRPERQLIFGNFGLLLLFGHDKRLMLKICYQLQDGLTPSQGQESEA
jgi:hypothetical protein